MTNKRGILIVFSGPSGSGKGTVLARAMEENKNLELSVSMTTRMPRTGEQDGVNYFFVTRDAFMKTAQEDGFLEWASFCDNCYGTPRAYVEERLSMGKDVVLEIEVQGAKKVKEKCPEAVLIFNLPPSMEELKARLVGRQTEPPEVVEKRLSAAKWEIENAKEYDYVIVNDEIESAKDKLLAIIESEKLKLSRNASLLNMF